MKEKVFLIKSIYILVFKYKLIWVLNVLYKFVQNLTMCNVVNYFASVSILDFQK